MNLFDCQNHVGKNCKKFYTPHQYPDLLPVNSVVCEQQVYSKTYMFGTYFIYFSSVAQTTTQT